MKDPLFYDTLTKETLPLSLSKAISSEQNVEELFSPLSLPRLISPSNHPTLIIYSNKGTIFGFPYFEKPPFLGFFIFCSPLSLSLPFSLSREHCQKTSHIIWRENPGQAPKEWNLSNTNHALKGKNGKQKETTHPELQENKIIKTK